MRDIEFRGKRTDNGEWVEGYYAHLHKTTYCVKEDCDAHPENELHRMIFEREQDWGLPNYHLQVDVDPETVGQYTGLKDKNGTKIFDGDIVLVPYIDLIFKCTWDDTSLSERAIVRYVDGMFYVEYIESGDKFTLSVMKGHMKIVGNIYDNPELLGGE